MRFACDSCSTKYSISDDRVRGRVLKIRCKKCDFVITVREDVQAAAAAVELPSAGEIGKAFDAVKPGAAGYGGDDERTTVGDVDGMAAGMFARGPGKASSEPKAEDDWYVSFDGEQEGPFSLAKASERVRAEHPTGKEAHAWRPGFLVWLPVEEVPELASALAPAKPPVRTPVRATTPVPLPSSSSSMGGPTSRSSSALPAQIAKDPSGPRAALGVSAGARPAAKPLTPPLGNAIGPIASVAARSSAPPIPAAAKGPTGLPSRPTASAPRIVEAPKAAAPPLPLPSTPSPPPPADTGGLPDLPISNEASGLVDMSKLVSALGHKPSGPAMINGHTGRHPAVPKYAPEPLAALEPPEPAPSEASASVPVVVVAGPAQGGTSPLFKWAALVGLVACVGLGIGVIYLLTHRPQPDTIIVTEPSRHQEDAPITVTDPTTGKAVPAPPEVKKVAVAKKAAPTQGRPAGGQNAKSGEGLSGSQRALANLYSDDGDRATPHDVPSAGPSRGAQGGQVSQSAILAVITQNRRALNLCYERVLKHDNSLKQGRVNVKISVGISGRVTSVVLPDAQYATSELGQCFTQAVKRWTFPASNDPYDTEFPFILQGQ